MLKMLVDCTLRDGGYVNDWNFGHGTIVSIVERMAQAGVEIIEVGFLDERQEENLNRSIQPTTKSYDKLLSCVNARDSKLVAMIDYGTCGLENIAECKDSVLDGIRIIFKKPKMNEAILFGTELVKRGYMVFLQMVSITSYSDRDLLDFVDLVNMNQPYAVSMVDTYGLMHKEEMINCFSLLDHNLAPEIAIGYHSHNNFQLAYANTTEMLKRDTKRELIVDGTAYGIGKSAGNAPIELLAMHLNEYYGKEYDLDQILEVIDGSILKIYQEHYWGYNLLYFIAASNDCHPNYANYLLNKKTLSIKSINDILKVIPNDKKLNFDNAYIERKYIEFQNKIRQGIKTIEELEASISKRKILLLAPGKTVLELRERINQYIIDNRPIIVSANFVPEFYNVDYAFICNAKRYSTIHADLSRFDGEIISTSNITPISRDFEYVVNYAELIDSNRLIEDNALILMLKLLRNIGIKEVALAGFDGFGSNTDGNYFDKSLDFAGDIERFKKINSIISERLNEMQSDISLEFITPSTYVN